MSEEVGALRVTLGLDTAEFNKNIKDVNNRLKIVQSEFKLAGAGINGFGSSLEGLRAKSRTLEQSLQLQQEKVTMLRQRYEELKATQGEDASATQRMLIQYNNAQTAMARMESQLNEVNARIRSQSSSFYTLGQRLQSVGSAMQSFGNKMKNIGSTMTMRITAPIVGVGVAATKMASDVDSATGLLQAKLGVTADKAAELGKVAEGVWKDNFGESINDVSDAVSVVNQNLEGIPTDQLKKAAEAAEFLADAFGADVGDSTKTASSLMKNFGITEQKAFDIMTTGFQQGGDYSGELLDTLNEYSVQFSSMGLSADQFLSILITGSKNGAFNLDKVGDAVKEFNLRAQDGSQTTAQGFKMIGLNAQQMGEAIAEGGDAGQNAFVATVSALAAMKDPLMQNIAGANLFGTQWEDVRKKVIFAMSDATKNILNVDGATQKASDALYNNFGSQMQKLWRNVQDDFEPVGEDLIKIAKDTLPRVASSVEKVTGAFADMSPEARKTIEIVAGLAAATGPVIVGIGTVASSIGALGKIAAPVIASIGADGLAGSLTALAGPVGIAVGGLGLVAAAGYAIKKSMDASKQANLVHAQSLINQQQSLKDLTTQYDDLRDKNKLSNDELLRFRDIQDELKTAKSADDIKTLKDEQDQLQHKSGLSNAELSKMLNLNDQIVNKTPGVQQAFNARGNAIISNKSAIDQVNAGLAENIQLELENQRIKADANLDTNIQNYIASLDELKAKEKERDNELKAVNETEVRLGNLKKQAQDQLNAGKDKEAQKTVNEIADTQILLNKQQGKLSMLADEVTQKQNSVNKSQEEITKTQQLYDKMINLQLAQVGINVKGSAGISQLDQAIQKTQTRIGQLNAVKQLHGGLNAEQQKELSNLQSALGKYQSTKSEIQKIQGEQQSVNQRINDGIGKAQGMNRELGKGINKKVGINDGGKADDLNAKVAKSITKKITLQAVWSGLTAGFKAALKMAGVPGFAVGTNFAPGGWSLVGEQGPELMYVPRGAQIKTASDTRNILNSTQTSAPSTSSTDIGALVNAIANLASRPISLIVNGREFAVATVDDITDLQDFKTNRSKIFTGR